jgi:Ca-activated chloride channel family protein
MWFSPSTPVGESELSGANIGRRLLRRLAVGICQIGLLAGAGVAAPQQPAGPLAAPLPPRPKPGTEQPNAPANARIDVNMVLIPVSVTDLSDRPVMDLKPNAFRVFEDGVEQKVSSVHREEGPVSIGFVFDASSSMKNRIDQSVKAMEQFLKTAIPGDEFYLIRFSDRPSVLTGFTPEPNDILHEMSGIRPEGWTSLNDAIVLAVQRMKGAKNARRALIVLTDGGDNNSRYSDSEVRSLARESNVTVYSIGLLERPRFMEKLAADTGGRAFWAHHIDDLPETVDRLSQELRNKYVLGYATQNPHNDGKYRRVRVEVLETIRQMPLHVFWRRGYYAPPD